MLVIHLMLQHRSTLECFMSPLSSHCNVMASLLTIILLKITFMNDTCILPADDSILGYAVIKDHSAGSYSFHPALCLYHDCRQKFYELQEFRTRVGKRNNSYLKPAGS